MNPDTTIATLIEWAKIIRKATRYGWSAERLDTAIRECGR